MNLFGLWNSHNSMRRLRYRYTKTMFQRWVSCVSWNREARSTSGWRPVKISTPPKTVNRCDPSAPCSWRRSTDAVSIYRSYWHCAPSRCDRVSGSTRPRHCAGSDFQCCAWCWGCDCAEANLPNAYYDGRRPGGRGPTRAGTGETMHVVLSRSASVSVRLLRRGCQRTEPLVFGHDLLGRAEGDDLSVMQAEGSVAGIPDQFEIVGDQEDRHPLRLEGLHAFLTLFLEDGIPHREKLIDQEQVRLDIGGDREPEASGHPNRIVHQRNINELLKLCEPNDAVKSLFELFL